MNFENSGHEVKNTANESLIGEASQARALWKEYKTKDDNGEAYYAHKREIIELLDEASTDPELHKKVVEELGFEVMQSIYPDFKEEQE